MRGPSLLGSRVLCRRTGWGQERQPGWGRRGGRIPPALFRIATAPHLTQWLTLSPQRGAAARRSWLGEPPPSFGAGLPLVPGQLRARLRAPSPPLPSSIYRSYFGNFLSELQAHSWDSVTAFPAAKPGISWRLLEPPGPWSPLLGDRGAAGRSPCCSREGALPSPIPGCWEAPIPASADSLLALQLLPDVSVSTCPTQPGKRTLSRLRT